MPTKIVANREEALRVGYEATDWIEPISKEDYSELMKNWSVEALERDGEVIGAVYRKDDELHIAVLPKWQCKWFTRSLLRQLFVGKRVVTRVTPGHDYMYSILQRLGFKELPSGMLVKEN